MIMSIKRLNDNTAPRVVSRSPTSATPDAFGGAIASEYSDRAKRNVSSALNNEHNQDNPLLNTIAAVNNKSGDFGDNFSANLNEGLSRYAPPVAPSSSTSSLDDVRSYAEKIAQQDWERDYNVWLDYQKYLAQRDDTKIQRLVADALAAGISPIHALGGGGSVAVVAPPSISTEIAKEPADNSLRDMSVIIRALVPLAMLFLKFMT